MGKQGEIDYVKNIGEDGIRHAVGKPFTDGDCAKYLFELGAVLTLLPPPPATLLDIGCGTGWTSRLFARRGYDVVGIDLAPDMVRHAREASARENTTNLRFETCDFESAPYTEAFDCAVFFDSLHHAVDEVSALRMAFRALKRGGVCVTSEPGTGHEQQPGTIEAAARFGVTEKDMPPRKIVDLATTVGFQDFRLVPHAFDVNAVLFKTVADMAAAEYSISTYRGKATETFNVLLSVLEDSGMVRMVKPAA